MPESFFLNDPAPLVAPLGACPSNGFRVISD